MTYEIKYRNEDEMKDSGIEWLGKIPREWDIKPIKYVSNHFNGYAFNSDNFIEDGIPIIRIGDIKDNIIFQNTKKSKENKKLEQYIIKRDDILIALTGATIGKTSDYNYDEIAYLNQRVGIFRSIKISQRLLSYWIKTEMVSEYIKLSCAGSAQENISNTNIAEFAIAIENSFQSEEITNFLDLKTAEFDSIVSKKELLIEKLEEAKKSLISEVVTGKVKIVDGELVEREPDEMKDSGVEWLGMIPKDWKFNKSKFLSNIFIPQRNKPELNADSGIPWVTIENLKGRYLNYKDNRRYVTKSAMKAYGSRILNKNSVITSCVGSFGMSSINQEDVIINQQLQAFTDIKINIEYLNYFIGLAGQYFDAVSTVTTLKYVNKEKFENLNTLVPTEMEQKTIVETLNLKIKEINSIITKTKLQIQKLKQAKQSLISEAVTGKIDLRDWVIQ